MASSPAPLSPRTIFTFTAGANGVCPTPGADSVFKRNLMSARRVIQLNAGPLAGPLDSLHAKIASLEGQNISLKAEVRDLSEQLSTALERAAQAEAAAQLAQASATPLPADEDECGADGNVPVETMSRDQLVKHVRALEQELLACQAARRQAHDQWVESRGAVRVACRIRPITQDAGPPSVRGAPDGTSVSVTVGEHESRFSFGRVYGPDVSSAQVYTDVNELVQSSLDGYQVCLMSYGQTGSGKTYSMLGTQQQPGIIPQALSKILDQCQRLRLQGWSHTVEASCMELYGNTLRDLLAVSTSGGSGAADNTAACGGIFDQNAIKHDSEGVTTVVGVSRHTLTGVDQALSLLQRAATARVSGATACNAQSSRSHCVFWLHIQGQHKTEGCKLTGSLCLVDLAGSERLERSQAQGVRQSEAAHINSSLSSLGDVFDALAAKRQHVPYRNSKLTYLLKPFLSPGGKTLFMVHINPDRPSAYESLTSLRFATKVSGTELGQATRKATQHNTHPSAPASHANSTQAPVTRRSAVDAPAGLATRAGTAAASVPPMQRWPPAPAHAATAAVSTAAAASAAAAAHAAGGHAASAAASVPQPTHPAASIPMQRWQPLPHAAAASVLEGHGLSSTWAQPHPPQQPDQPQQPQHQPPVWSDAAADFGGVPDGRVDASEDTAGAVFNLRAGLRRKRQIGQQGTGVSSGQPANKRAKGAWY